MSQLFRNYGIQFRYPDDWAIDEDEGEDQVTITVSRDPACFWSMTLMADRPEPQEVLDEAIDAYREEYPDLDVTATKETIARRPALACEVEFVSMELVNIAHLRAFRTPVQTVFLMYQVTDHESKGPEAQFKEITASLEADLNAE
jgi:hypothetical protein